MLNIGVEFCISEKFYSKVAWIAMLELCHFQLAKLRVMVVVAQGFFPGGLGGPPIQRKVCQSPPSLSPFLDQGLSPPAEVCPWKFEKFKYINVSNLTTFKLKITLKSGISCLK